VVPTVASISSPHAALGLPSEASDGILRNLARPITSSRLGRDQRPTARRHGRFIVHSFSRFFRDQFQLEFYVRRLAKNGVRLVSITQDLGEDPMSVMMRQIMALFDEYQSKENAKHTLRAMRENARLGFWNGSRPPFGYRVVAAEQRGARTKKKLEVDPAQAEHVRLMFRLVRIGDGERGPLGANLIADYLNQKGIRTSGGGRWGVGAVHQILTRTTYVGEHRFNVSSWRKREEKPEDESLARRWRLPKGRGRGRESRAGRPG
jgi:hypothetical protein